VVVGEQSIHQPAAGGAGREKKERKKERRKEGCKEGNALIGCN